MTDPAADPQRLILDADERRVLGTMIEKGLTSPQSYPLTLNALTTGCNQKSNRDPVTHYTDEQAEAICERLKQRNLVSHLFPTDGRVSRWRQEVGRNFELRGVELGVVGELFLRGAQSEGELRQRASRMREIATLEELREILNKLRDHSPPLVMRLSAESAGRGVRWSHATYSEAEMQRLTAAEAAGVSEAPASGPASAGRSHPGELAELRQRVDELEARLARIEAALRRA